MFTGIIETVGVVKEVIPNGFNKTFWIGSPLSSEFKVDQSISHSGVCLTVEAIKGNLHRVTSIDETLQKTNLNSWQADTIINIERSLLLDSRLDGHFVQGHADTTGICKKRIEKGSVCVNGISLTAFNIKKKSFTVAIIPFTYKHTNINQVMPGDTVNIEFDIIGKYLLRRLSLKAK